jgi:hypothetical protein
MDTTANDSSSNLFSVTPFEAATWQLRNLADVIERWEVALPALQRGAVWRPKQVEALWDSLIRGFPIGSFLLAPYDQRRGSRSPRYGSALDDVDYHLLDGQQRWNAITLGFVDIWKSNPEFRDNLDALWVDLARPEVLTDGREFVFRVVTHSHPWGYRRDDPNSRLSAQNRRQAPEAYENAYRETHSSVGTDSDIRFQPGKLPPYVCLALGGESTRAVRLHCGRGQGQCSCQRGMDDGASVYGVPCVLERYVCA